MCIVHVHVQFSRLTDVEAEYESILDKNPFWGHGEPRGWHTFMQFGAGGLVRDPNHIPQVWTQTTARGMRKRSAGRAHQRERTKSARAELRERANAK